MTPSMGMAAPKGMAPAAPQAGLAAIAKPATAQKGMSSGNMAQVMSLARKMSDAQLAEVLQGKSLDVPQYVAMTEAMGRKQLRTAMGGAQAMAQAQQPSVKDKLLMSEQPQMQGMPQGMPQMPQQPVMAAEGGLMYAGGGAIDMNESANMGGGIAELPAPNMDAMTMAGGGIVAFNGEKGSEVEDEQARKDREALKYGWENTKAAARDILTLPGRGLAGAFESAVTRPVRAMGVDMPYLPSSFYGGDVSSLTPHMDTLTKQRESQAASKTTPTINSTPSQAEIDAIRATNAPAPAAGPTKAQIDAINARPKSGAGGSKSGADQLTSYDDAIKANKEGYLAKLEGLGAKQREGLAKLRSEGGGEALMQLAGALFGNPNMAMALGKGLPAVATTAAASRKEQRQVENAANEMDLNLAKARAAEQAGDLDRAMHYKKLAQDAQYQQGMLAYHNASLNKPDSGIALLNALKDPKNMAIYKEMSAAKKGDVYSIDKATDDFNSVMKDKFSDQAKALKQAGITNPYQYQQYVLQQGTMGGGNGVKFLGFE